MEVSTASPCSYALSAAIHCEHTHTPFTPLGFSFLSQREGIFLNKYSKTNIHYLKKVKGDRVSIKGVPQKMATTPEILLLCRLLPW